ncbi:CRISPR-associated endonuclease Cas2 [Chitinilyticum piscinae]|uniref:CRISPR-associated endoribonuclease Cas2 n=1 Tax=Chitinilyticum piscinae TaxID=2866724 RepID=A0A8J7K336_9NEIS|nr:CRISPR-associated endonuclease Cas2 [Chitinilyticum piscinae]MBE9610837.1 CRISPR-associated endonuclease Cas2 [Chitinilyticum piscinae]
MSVRRLWLICYDIADDERRQAAARLLLRHGERVQLSAYEIYLRNVELDALLVQLQQVLDPQLDILSAYPLCSWCRNQVHWQGEGRRPEDPGYWQIG